MFLYSLLRWIFPPSRRSRFITTLFWITVFSLFFGFFPAHGQDNTSGQIWLDSPTQPRLLCGAAWGEFNPFGNQKFHNAWDFCGGYRGGPVTAVADGIVVYADWWQKDYQPLDLGHGWTLAVWHPRNRIYSYYTHLQEFKMSVGQVVKQGDVVGLEGDTGKASGTHVHFVTAIMEPQRLEKPGNCPQPYCFPDPQAFLGKDTIAQDLGLTTISPTGEVFKPAPGMPTYTGGKDDILDTSYMSFVQTAMSTTIPFTPVSPSNTTQYIITDFDFEDLAVDEIEQENPPETQAQFMAKPLNSKWEQPLKILLACLCFFFLLACIFSKKFREGAIWVVLIATLCLLIGLLVLSFLP